jgi:hypothetical protein
MIDHLSWVGGGTSCDHVVTVLLLSYVCSPVTSQCFFCHDVLVIWIMV